MAPEGNGLQSVYLTEIGRTLVWVLFWRIGADSGRVVGVGQKVSRVECDSPAPERDIEEWERRVEKDTNSDVASRRVPARGTSTRDRLADDVTLEQTVASSQSITTGMSTCTTGQARAVVWLDPNTLKTASVVDGGAQR